MIRFLTRIVAVCLVCFGLASMAFAANPDNPVGFTPHQQMASGSAEIEYPCAAAATFVRGDPVIFNAGVAIATAASSVEILGVAAEGCTAGVADSGSFVSVWPAEIWIFRAQSDDAVYADATNRGRLYGLKGTTGVFEIDLDETTAASFIVDGLVTDAVHGAGTNAVLFGRFSRPYSQAVRDIGLAELPTTLARANYGLSYSTTTGMQIDLVAAGAGTGGLHFSGGDLEIDLGSDPGLELTADGVEVDTDTDYGLVKHADGIRIDLEPNGAGTGGLEFTGGDLQVDAEAAGAGTGGLALVAGGLQVLTEAAGAGTGGLAQVAGGMRVLIQAAGAGTGGLALTATGLAPLIEAAGVGAGGIEQTAAGLAVMVQAAGAGTGGLVQTATGLAPMIEAAGVGAGGIEQTAAGLSVMIEAAGAGTGGLAQTATGLAPYIQAAGAGTGGLAQTATGLQVLTEAAGVGTGGLAQVAGGMRLLTDGAHGIVLTATGAEAEVDAASGMAVGAAGLAVNPDDDWLDFNANEIAIERLIIRCSAEVGGANTFTAVDCEPAPVACTVTHAYVTSTVGTASAAGNLWTICPADSGHNSMCTAGWDTNAHGDLTAHQGLDISARLDQNLALVVGELVEVVWTETGAATDQSAGLVAAVLYCDAF